MGRQNESPWVSLFYFIQVTFEGMMGAFHHSLSLRIVWYACLQGDIICLTKLLKLWAHVSRSIICFELLGHSHICKSIETKAFYIFYLFPGMSRSKYEMRKCINRNMNILWFTKVGYMVHLPNMIRHEPFRVHSCGKHGQKFDTGRAVLNYLGGLLLVTAVWWCRVPELRWKHQCNNCALSNVDIAKNACV